MAVTNDSYRLPHYVYDDYINTSNQNSAFNAIQAQIDRDWQEAMSSTSYQRAVYDLRLAGLNPVLAASNGGASTPSGAVASADTSANAAVQATRTAKLNSDLQLALAKINQQTALKTTAMSAKAGITQSQLSAAATQAAAGATAGATMAAAQLSADAQRYASDQSYKASTYSSDNSTYASNFKTMYGNPLSYLMTGLSNWKDTKGVSGDTFLKGLNKH